MSIVKLNNKIVKLGGKLVTLNPAAPPPETVMDYDGNTYDVVTIGTQKWTVQNLKTTHYNDGTPIPNISNYNDWFLPSKDELYQIWNQLYTWGFGNFSPQTYWSSSEWYNDTSGWNLDFSNGSEGGYSKSSGHGVRACRSFTGGSYNLRDIGPAGGRIFITGSTYYECAPSDSSLSYIWSNITTPLTTTGTAIGSGQTNTNLIIGQVGHTSSAAKLTDDLTSDMLWERDLYGAHCWYDSDEGTYKDPYGAIYNWYAVDNIHGIAPTGWRVPNDTDWTTLITYVGGDTVAGGQLKEIGLTHWNTPNTGAADTYGFKCLGSGYRTNTGTFTDILNGTILHGSSSSGVNSTQVFFYFSWNNLSFATGGSKVVGKSIRLVKI